MAVCSFIAYFARKFETVFRDHILLLFLFLPPKVQNKNTHQV